MRQDKGRLKINSDFQTCLAVRSDLKHFLHSQTTLLAGPSPLSPRHVTYLPFLVTFG